MSSGATTRRITTRNSAFQVFASLRANRQKRHASGTFLVEGVRPLTMAVERGWEFDALLLPERPLSRWAAALAARVPSAVRYLVAPALLVELSGKDEGSEILAVLRMREPDVATLASRPTLLVAVMDRPGNPGNLGTCIRSCDALGADALFVTGHAVDVYDPATITASRGSLFALPVVRLASPADVAAFVARVRERQGRCRIVACDEQGAVALDAADLSRPLLIVFGNETHGLSHAYRQLADALVRIPMAGAASSLNVGVALSIAVYEAAKRGRATKS